VEIASPHFKEITEEIPLRSVSLQLAAEELEHTEKVPLLEQTILKQENKVALRVALVQVTVQKWRLSSLHLRPEATEIGVVELLTEEPGGPPAAVEVLGKLGKRRSRTDPQTPVREEMVLEAISMEITSTTRLAAVDQFTTEQMVFLSGLETVDSAGEVEAL
jgi:hypothetical protein